MFLDKTRRVNTNWFYSSQNSQGKEGGRVWSPGGRSPFSLPQLELRSWNLAMAMSHHAGRKFKFKIMELMKKIHKSFCHSSSKKTQSCIFRRKTLCCILNSNRSCYISAFGLASTDVVMLECVSSFSTIDQIPKNRSNRFCLSLKVN